MGTCVGPRPRPHGPAPNRGRVWVQAVFGQFFMAVFVARLIGMQAPAADCPVADADVAEPHGDVPAHVTVAPRRAAA